MISSLSFYTIFWSTPKIRSNMLKISERSLKNQGAAIVFKASKSQFMSESIEFSGRVKLEGMSPISEKLRAIREWKLPNDVISVKFFWLRELLLAFRPSFRGYYPVLDPVDKERSCIALGNPTKESI